MSKLSILASLGVLHVVLFASEDTHAALLGTLEHTFDFHANGLSTDPFRPLVYATTNTSLEIINSNTLTVEKSLPLPNGGIGMSLSPDNSRLFVAGGKSNSV